MKNIQKKNIKHFEKIAKGEDTNKLVSHSIEAELNKIIKLDENNDGKVLFGEFSDFDDFKMTSTGLNSLISSLLLEDDLRFKKDMSGEKFEGDENYDKARKAFLKAKLQGLNALSADKKELLLSYPQFSLALKDEKELESVIENISINLESSKMDLNA